MASIVDNERLIEIVRIWEDTMEQDFQGLFNFFGKTGPALTDNFVRVNYRGITIRCQTFSKEDFGSCYAMTLKHFVFTTSLASMQKTLDILK